MYDPYVHFQEHEVEYRGLFQQDDDPTLNGMKLHKLGYGTSITEKLFTEVYFIGSNREDDGVKLDATEVELKWQLTEQGQYSNDWGLLFELERENDFDHWEAASTLIMLHEWNRWVATANLSVLYEWGDQTQSEWETAFSGQFRYRYNESLEPAIEFYQAQDTQGIGPVLTGLVRFGQTGKLYWRTGVILGLDKTTPESSWVLNLEYEFR